MKGAKDVEQFFAERVVLNHVLSYYRLSEIVGTLGISYRHAQTIIKYLLEQKRIVPHPDGASYRMDRSYFNENYKITDDNIISIKKELESIRKTIESQND